MLSLGWVADFLWQGARAESQARHLASQPVTSPGKDVPIGLLEAPQIGLSVPIFATFDENSFRRGVGHLAGTAMPGGLGNMALAGHRDTYFRPLAGIRPGMVLRATTGGETFQYVVRSTEIVSPEAVRVLDIGAHPEMTMITCYPFHFFGHAPKRFIVHAALVSAAPVSPPMHAQ